MNLYSLILDAVVIILAILIIRAGYRRGFLHSITMAIGFVAAAVIAMTFSGYAARYLYDGFLEKPIADAIEHTVLAETDALSFDTVVPELLDKLPKIVSNSVLAVYGGEADLIRSLQEGTDGALENFGTVITENIISPVAISLLQALMCLLIFSICVIIVKMVAGVFRGFSGIPVIGPINSLLGALLGTVQALILLYGLSLIVSVVISLSANKLEWLNTGIIDATWFFKLFYDCKLF